jgi:site-specific DNA-methyltransferase (adenine-specific)
MGNGWQTDPEITAPATKAAKQWQGWGTALKPAHEPIVMARKPITETVAANVLEHGTGAINVDGCRVETDENLNGGRYSDNKQGTDGASYGSGINKRSANNYLQPKGRWPANFIHDGSDEVTQGLGEASRYFYCAKASKRDRDDGCNRKKSTVSGVGALKDNGRQSLFRKNNHPTVKPTDLMRYLVRMVTPPNGTVLDPFTGSGSTGKACMLEGFDFVGCELSDEYAEIAKARIEQAKSKKPESQEDLFSD